MLAKLYFVQSTLNNQLGYNAKQKINCLLCTLLTLKLHYQWKTLKEFPDFTARLLVFIYN